MLTPLFELYNVFAPENEKERTNVWQTKVRSFVAGIAGFEPANAGVKVLCLNRLGYIPVCLFACMSIQQSGRFVKSGFACAVAAFARRVVGAPLTDALPSQQNPRRPPGTRLQWCTGEAPCGGRCFAVCGGAQPRANE